MSVFVFCYYMYMSMFFFFNDKATTEIYTYGHTLSLHDALPISRATGSVVIGRKIAARVGQGVAAFDPAEWDRCAGTDHPFTTHAFLSALEESGSATAAAGWQPVPIAIEDLDGRLAAVMPAYAKSNSQGEYVFDHAWADAFERAGGR